jgi:hypothetical protein
MTRQQHPRRVATLCIYCINCIAFKRVGRAELINRPENEFFGRLMVTLLIYAFSNGADYLAIKMASTTGKKLLQIMMDSSLVYLRR